MSADSPDLEILPDAKLPPPLQDIKEIVESRPDLTPTEWDAANKAAPWIKATLRPEVRAELEDEYSQLLADARLRDEERIKETIKTSMQAWKDEQEPLAQEDLQKLLTQEYITFNVKVMERGGNLRDFTLVELSQEVESKFVTLMQKHLLPVIETMNSLDFRLQANWSKSLQTMLESFPQVMDVAAELVAVCLNPWGDASDVDGAWVKKSLATHRIVKILIAQQEVNRYRDFFSNDFQLFRISSRR